MEKTQNSRNKFKYINNYNTFKWIDFINKH